MGWISQADIDRWFSYQRPNDEDTQRIVTIRAKARELAETIVSLTPKCADQSAAVRKIREAVATANAAIVCRPFIAPDATNPVSPNAYLASPAPAPDPPAVGLVFARDGAYAWRCPGCDATNYGKVTPPHQRVIEVTCVHCTATFRTG
jgi:hypothetical protein